MKSTEVGLESDSLIILVYHDYCMLGANFGVLLYGDVSMMCFVSVEISVYSKVPKFVDAGKLC